MAPRAKTDIEIVLLLYIPLFAILFGFVAPLFIVVVEASKMDFRGFNYHYEKWGYESKKYREEWDIE